MLFILFQVSHWTRRLEAELRTLQLQQLCVMAPAPCLSLRLQLSNNLKNSVGTIRCLSQQLLLHTSRRAGAYSIIQHRRSIHKVIRQFWSASFPCFHVGQMSSLETPHNKTGSRIWFDVEWFGTSLGQPEICPGWSAPSWCWPAPPAPSSRSPCPSPTRAPPPCSAPRGHVSGHVYSGWPRLLPLPILTADSYCITPQ